MLKRGIIFLGQVACDIIVKQVNSDTELTYSAEIDVSVSKTERPFKVEKKLYRGIMKEKQILPKLDQSMMYEAVWQRLKEDGCVGIFPEVRFISDWFLNKYNQGGSHDRTQMLPLKAGVCIMALGAMTKNCKPIRIVPCGFNYFEVEIFYKEVF